MEHPPTDPRAIGGFGDHPENINRRGRPPGISRIKPLLETITDEQYEGDASRLEAMIRKVVDMATEGDMAAVKWLSERLDGKVADRIQASVLPEQFRDDGD